MVNHPKIKESNEKETRYVIRVPSSFSLGELIKIAVALVTLTIAWDLVGTRVTLVENSVKVLNTQHEHILARDKEVDTKLQTLFSRQQENSSLIDNLYIASKKVIPPRQPNN
jgi:hypothetical protein